MNVSEQDQKLIRSAVDTYNEVLAKRIAEVVASDDIESAITFATTSALEQVSNALGHLSACIISQYGFRATEKVLETIGLVSAKRAARIVEAEAGHVLEMIRDLRKERGKHEQN